MTRSIKVMKWMENVGQKEVESNTCKMISALMQITPPERVPRGIDKFRLMHRIYNALEEAENTGNIEISEGDYTIIRRLVENEVPSNWAKHPDIVNSIEMVLQATKIDDK